MDVAECGALDRAPYRRDSTRYGLNGTFSKVIAMRKLSTYAAIAILFAGITAGQQSRTASHAAPKPRIVVTTDPELDDLNSLTRYLLYSTDFQTEGLIYASSQFHWKGDGKGTKFMVPEREYDRNGLHLCPCTSWRWYDSHIDDAVNAYAQGYPNLKIHNPEYPSPQELKSKIRIGNIDFEGEMSKDTPGSDLVKEILLDDKGGPVYLLGWGGMSTIARALKSIEETYTGKPQWPSIEAKISRKAVILASGDQDGTLAGYIHPKWSEIEIRSLTGGPRLSYGAQRGASPEDAPYMTAEWMKSNVSNRGPMGELYRVWGDGKQMAKGDVTDYFGLSGYTDQQLKDKGYGVWTPVEEKGSWIGEGDTYTFLNFPNNGLRAYENAAWGGWAGHGPAPGGRGGEAPAAGGPLEPDFFPAIQNDFAARMKWAVTPKFADANHEPIVRIIGEPAIVARAGETVRLKGEVSDPDGNTVSVKWWQYRTSETYPGEIHLSNTDTLATTFRVPADAAPGNTIHVILEATDNGTPRLTRYQRVVVTVAPR